MTVFVNPGSGPVRGANVEEAAVNMRHFVIDLGEGWDFVRMRDTADYGEGRFAFLVWKGNHCAEIQMPGIPLDCVRYVGAEGQNIWDYPRLYVDGSSWVWEFAVNAAKPDEVES
jgi:hypothetical protein